MQRGGTKPNPCGMHGLLEMLAGPWTPHMLGTLSTHGAARFGNLPRQVEGISSRVLTERLRELERNGFVFRDYQPTIPPSVTYGITSRMKDISKVLAQLAELAKKWQQEDAQVPSKPHALKSKRASADPDHAHDLQNLHA